MNKGLIAALLSGVFFCETALAQVVDLGIPLEDNKAETTEKRQEEKSKELPTVDDLPEIKDLRATPPDEEQTAQSQGTSNEEAAANDKNAQTTEPPASESDNQEKESGLFSFFNMSFFGKNDDIAKEAAQNKEDVVFAKDENEKNIAITRFNERGVTDIVVTAHVVGDLVKFYGVRNTMFFRTFYPGDNGWSKFGDETVNGLPHHYTFPVGKLWQDADKLASLAGVDIYGGDCIVKADGTYAIIDFNDWPSFAVCRDDAAEAIAMIAERQADKKVKS